MASYVGDNQLAEQFERLAGQWVNAFAPDGLLLDSTYYEGGRWNYSFRLLHDMQARIELAGGEGAFIELLDQFFGYGADPVKQLGERPSVADQAAGYALNRFEGLNNEPDMEAPWAYHYAGRPDRTAEVVHAASTTCSALGRGGLPGNDDSGGLSSWYVWASLGLFPVAGQSLYLINAPSFAEARIDLGRQRACHRCARLRRARRRRSRPVCAVGDLQRRNAGSDLADARASCTAAAICGWSSGRDRRVGARRPGLHQPQTRPPSAASGQASSNSGSIQMIIQTTGSSIMTAAKNKTSGHSRHQRRLVIVVRADPVICGHSGEARNLAEAALQRGFTDVRILTWPLDLLGHVGPAAQAARRRAALQQGHRGRASGAGRRLQGAGRALSGRHDRTAGRAVHRRRADGVHVAVPEPAHACRLRGVPGRPVHGAARAGSTIAEAVGSDVTNVVRSCVADGRFGAAAQVLSAYLDSDVPVAVSDYTQDLIISSAEEIDAEPRHVLRRALPAAGGDLLPGDQHRGLPPDIWTRANDGGAGPARSDARWLRAVPVPARPRQGGRRPDHRVCCEPSVQRTHPGDRGQRARG